MLYLSCSFSLKGKKINSAGSKILITFEPLMTVICNYGKIKMGMHLPQSPSHTPQESRRYGWAHHVGVTDPFVV